MDLSRDLSLYATATTADLVEPLADWDFSGGRGLLLHGDPGVGKTHAAYALWRSYCAQPSDYPNNPIRSGRVAPFISVAQYLRAKKESFDAAPGERQKDIDWAGIVRFAVFDDFDKARLTPWAQEELFTIIDTLYTRRVPIIVTSNSNAPRDFIRHAGPYIGDRIKAMCVPHAMKGKSRRVSPV